MANMQPHQSLMANPSGHFQQPDPANQSGSRISPEDLQIIKGKCPHLSEFSDEFLQFRTLDELLRLESTSLRIKDADKSRDSEDRLASNKAAMVSKFYEVSQGRDNRSTELHPARFLPSMACSAEKQFMAARQVLGLSSPPALSCYDMNSVGMGGWVTSRGWLELGTMGSSKMKVSMFSINNAAKSTSLKSSDTEDKHEMKDVSEFERALRTLRAAAQLVVPWNLSFLALENFLYDKGYCKDELKHDDNPARTLCQFCDFALGENANKWRDGTGFLSYNDLTGYWSSFIGARPQLRAGNPAAGPSSSQAKAQPRAKDQLGSKKRKYPFTGICNRFNTNNCQRAPGSCFGFRGEPLRHVCNWRDPSLPNAQPCGQAHMRVVAH